VACQPGEVTQLGEENTLIRTLGQALRVNSEEKSGAGVSKAVPKYIQSCHSFGFISSVESGDLLHGLQWFSISSCPGMCLRVDTPALLQSVNTTREATVNNDEPMFNWPTVLRQGLLLTLGGF